MFLTHSSVIRGLSKSEYFMLREMCFFSNNLYNVALYNVRQYFFNERRFLSFESNCSVCKDNENYKLLQAGVSQQTLKLVDRSFKAFFNLLKKARRGEYSFHDIRIPHYRKKGGLFVVVMSTNAINIKNGTLTLPMSRTFSELHQGHKIQISIPRRLIGKKIKEVRLLPLRNGKAFKLQYVYEQEPEPLNLNRNNTLAIDIGLDNLATCVTNAGTSFIMDGRKLKSINQYWNKQRAYLQAIAMKQRQRTTDLIARLTIRRNHRANDFIKKTARHIINCCIANDIGTIVCGYNPDFKRGINFGKRTNQSFTQISFGSLREQIRTLCERYNISYIEQEESYTSKASFLDLDELPVYSAQAPYKGVFSGERMKRGLYRASDGRFLNADVNGAANILRKSKQNFNFEELCRGLLASPLRIRVP